MKPLIPFIPALMCVLWGLVCLRVYRMISRRNVWQRHFIAIAAGLGGALVYLVTKMILAYLLTPMPEPEPVRVQLKAQTP